MPTPHPSRRAAPRSPEGVDRPRVDAATRRLALRALAVVVLGVNLVGPWVIQLLARPLTRTSNPATLLSMRRLAAAPKSAWRNVSGLALLGLITAFTIVMPANFGDSEPLFQIQFADMRTGAIITLAIGLVLSATSTLINQASATVDRAARQWRRQTPLRGGSHLVGARPVATKRLSQRAQCRPERTGRTRRRGILNRHRFLTVSQCLQRRAVGPEIGRDHDESGLHEGSSDGRRHLEDHLPQSSAVQ